MAVDRIPKSAVTMIPPKILACLKAPDGGGDLELAGDTLQCPETGQTYPFLDGVPSLFRSDGHSGENVTKRVKTFYEKNPFPNYDGMEEFGELVNKGINNTFSAQLLEAVGYNKTVLECGCGTGQLSHFLQLNNNHVLGVDMSLASLKLALRHKLHNELQRSAFAQMNIFDLAIKDESFDVVIAHGVLHHTFDARQAFSEIARKVKPGGIVMVGLYNRCARVPTWLRGRLIKLLGPRIDYVVRHRIRDARKADIWIKDQYFNPHETWHSIDEVMGWFDENHIGFLNCSPPIMGSSGEATENIFTQSDPGSAYQRAVTQLFWLGSIAREGALFDMVGRKQAEP